MSSAEVLPQETSTESENQAQEIEAFVGRNARYYQRQFDRIGSKAGFVVTFNWAAAVLGPIWFAGRGLWKWALPFAVLETFALVQIARALWGDLATDLRQRLETIQLQLNIRNNQLEDALANEADNLDAIQRNVDTLKTFMVNIEGEIQSTEAGRIWLLLLGLVLLLLWKLCQGLLANPSLEKLYSLWLSDRTIKPGLDSFRLVQGVLFVVVVYCASILEFAVPGTIGVMADFPTDPDVRLEAIAGIETFFDTVASAGEQVFDGIALAIRTVLDALETVFVETPWIVVLVFFVTLTALSSGVRAAIYTGAFLCYMGVIGLWELSMQTFALLGTAACIAIGLGIPLGIFCARRPRFYAFVRPVLDFQQTMPAFVYMIPIIAFFGTGKPAAVMTCLIFGMPPVVRLTVLGLQGVPESIREAAITYGASSWYLLIKVDLPLAAPSIRTGMNQTILLSLLTVVVASLIGAKGLGEDVLEALQYASVGQGILAGFAILFIAMILDRIIQGRRNRA